MFGFSRLALAAASAITLLSGHVVASVAITTTPSVNTYTFPITRSGVTYRLEYCATSSVGVASTSVTRVVVSVHGDSRNACDYAEYVAQASVTAGQAANTLVVAPRFLISSDIGKTSTALYWSDSGWKEGNTSLTSPYARSWRISSYEALDLLLTDIGGSGRFPNLAKVVVAGHSAGGQYVNRYAAGAKWRPSAAIAESFVVANPSSYLYWDNQRKAGEQWRTLTAAEVSDCPDYDTYKYGLVGRNTYMSTWTASALKSNYANSKVWYLLGALDDDPESSSLDVTCPAQWQGSQRLERGQWYFERLPIVLGAGITTNQSLAVVPNVGHSADDMFNSAEGLMALFS